MLDKASECRRRPRSYRVDPFSRRREVAHGVLCSSPKPEQTFFSPRSSSESRGIEIFCRLFLHTSRRHTFDLDTEQNHGQRASYRARPVNMDGELRNFMWIHGLGGERLLVMPYALCPNPANAYFLPSKIDTGRDFFVTCFLYPSGQMLFSQTPGRRPPYITGLRVNSVTLGWVGPPNERAPLRVHDAIAVFAARCLTRTRIADQGLGGGS